MTKLSLDITEKLIDACKAGAGEAAGSLAAALDRSMQISDVVGLEPTSADELPEALAGRGLALSLATDEGAFGILLPESTGLLPDWYAEPDPTGESKLQTLAQELAMLLLPEDLVADKFAAGAVDNLASAAQAAKLADPAGCVQLQVTGDDNFGAFYLVWPLAEPDALLPQPQETAEAEPQATEPPATPATRSPAVASSTLHGYDALPLYSRSLLSIKVPVVVNLAETKMSVDDVVHLGPGAIIQFEKACDDTLELAAGEHTIAHGEAVKVGDKFGLRITSIRLPQERYRAVGE